jgi:Cu2+-containing amine oxidase
MRWRSFTWAALAMLVLSVPVAAQTPPPWMPCSGINLVDQAFPTTGPEQTHWRLCWNTDPQQGLLIHWAFFRPSPNARWIWIFWDARVSDIFVPYHQGWPRYYDMSDYSFPLTAIGPADCPASLGGTPLGGNVCKQVHDRGLLWKNWSQVRRGEEVVLWSALGAANYNYIIEWTFRDDGVVLGRVGATAANLPSLPFEPHIHNPIWRLDIDLDGFWGDSVKFDTHTENLPGLTATDSEPLISSESGQDWDPHQFNELHVYDATLKNGKGDPTSLHLMPLPTSGLSRHQETFTQHDFWVTHFDPFEFQARYLPNYISTPEPVSNADIVVWYKGSIHHHPRDEDGEITSSGGWNGVALVMWTGWMLKPNNLFDRTPFYP